jgi:hypothetical protein
VAEYDAAEASEKGALLRREGLYSSHMVEWRRVSDAGALDGLTAKPRGASQCSEQVENDRLRRDNERLARELAKTRAALEVKYAPVFPDRFGCLADARAFCERFFDYYHHQDHHSGPGWHTPASVHHGTAAQVRARRAVTLDTAYQANPAQFTRRPQPPRLPQTAWINQPSREALIQTA